MADMESLAASIQQEGDSPFEEKENETLSESQTENNEQSETPPSHQGGEKEESEAPNTDDEQNKKTENYVPYDRFKEVIKDKNELKQKLEELEQTVQKKLNVPSQDDVTIPEWFTAIHGDDPIAWSKYKDYEDKKFSEWKNSIKNEELTQKKQYEENVKRWEDYTNSQIDRLKEEGKELDKNEFMKVVFDFRPTNEQGSIDFDKAYIIYEAQKKAEYNPVKSQAKKNIAASTVSDNRGDPSKKDYVTSNDLRKYKNATDLIN